MEKKTTLKVVLIDDDEDLLKLLVFAFTFHGIKIDAFSTGTEALEYFNDEQNLQTTHLVILDRILPDIDGINILKTLSEKYGDKKPMVIILSILSSEQDVLMAYEAGAIDCLTKPFNLQILIDKSLALLSKF